MESINFLISKKIFKLDFLKKEDSLKCHDYINDLNLAMVAVEKAKAPVTIKNYGAQDGSTFLVQSYTGDGEITYFEGNNLARELCVAALTYIGVPSKDIYLALNKEKMC